MSSIPDTQTQAALASNKIALAAMAISIAAFIIAYLQLLLGNLMSGNALWKTNQASIGVAARHRSWRLGLRRVKILYPYIDFRVMSILHAAHESSKSRIESSFLDKLARKTHCEWKTVAVRRDISSIHVTDHYSALFDPKEGSYVTRHTLGLIHRVRFWWWRQRNLIFLADRPRATWANILQAYRITDATHLIHFGLDADAIPSGIDVPVQRIRMFDLGQLALMMGCTTVRINISSRHFHAECPHCIITSEEIPGFGTAAKFEGDIRFISQIEIWKCSHESIALAMAMTVGHFSMGKFLTRGLVDLHLLYQAVDENWSRSIFFETSERQAAMIDFQSQFTPGHFVQETERLSLCFTASEAPFRLYHKDTPFEKALSTLKQLIHSGNPKITPEEEVLNIPPSKGAHELAFTVWQHSTQLIVPTIFPAAIIAAIPYVFCGFPSSTFLGYLLPWLRFEARHVLEANELLKQHGVIISACSAQKRALLGEINFLNSNALIRIGQTPSEKDDTRKCSWFSGRRALEYFALPEDIRKSFGAHNPSTRRLDNVKAPILPQTKHLLEDFRPQVWAENIRAKLRDMRWKLYPSNMLWFQVVLLDIAIRLEIKKRVDQLDAIEPHQVGMGTTFEGKEILKAIVESYHPIRACNSDGDSSFLSEKPSAHHSPECKEGNVTRDLQTWDLHKALIDHCSFYKDLTAEEAAREYGRLAIMLKLRALFFIAFLMVGPDSSQVYEARASEAHIPII